MQMRFFDVLHLQLGVEQMTLKTITFPQIAPFEAFDRCIGDVLCMWPARRITRTGTLWFVLRAIKEVITNKECQFLSQLTRSSLSYAHSHTVRNCSPAPIGAWRPSGHGPNIAYQLVGPGTTFLSWDKLLSQDIRISAAGSYMAYGLCIQTLVRRSRTLVVYY